MFVNQKGETPSGLYSTHTIDCLTHTPCFKKQPPKQKQSESSPRTLQDPKTTNTVVGTSKKASPVYCIAYTPIIRSTVFWLKAALIRSTRSLPQGNGMNSSVGPVPKYLNKGSWLRRSPTMLCFRPSVSTTAWPEKINGTIGFTQIQLNL